MKDFKNSKIREGRFSLRVLKLCLTVLLLVSASSVRATGTTSYTVSNVGEFILNTDGLITNFIPDGDNPPTKLTIPTSLGGVSIVGIADGAGIDGNFTEVVIPVSLQSIGKDAFVRKTSLTTLTFTQVTNEEPSSMSIGESAFLGCSNLTTINNMVGNRNIISIGNYAFSSTGLTSVNIPASTTTIGDGAFAYCTELESITVESGNTNYTADNSVLCDKNNRLLCYPPKKAGELYTLPDAVTSIGVQAFSSCTNLTSVNLNKVTEIGAYAFTGCKNLATVTNLKGTSIAGSVFNSCTKLETISIPNTVTTIDFLAFAGSGLKSVTLPNSVTNIGLGAFYACTALTSIVIPNSVTTINDDAFNGCTNLTTVTIPNSVGSIGSSAFQGCTKLNAVYAEKPDATIGDNAFGSTDYPIANDAKLYVPKCRESNDWTNWTTTGKSSPALTVTGRTSKTTENLSFAANEPISRYYQYPVTIPDGVTAYYGKELTGNKSKLTLKKIETAYIPAGTAVLLYKNDNAAGTVAISESSDAQYTPITNNVLNGSITDTYVGEGGTILTLGHNVADKTQYGFFTNSKYTANANRAYLTYDQVYVGGGAAQGITITMDDPTGINEVPAWQQPAVGGTDKVYHLDGTYEPEPQKGVIYIVNGKKVIYL